MKVYTLQERIADFPGEEIRQRSLLASAEDDPIYCIHATAKSGEYWFTTSVSQAAALCNVNIRMETVWTRDALIAALGPHTAAWDLLQLAAGLFAKRGPEPKMVLPSRTAKLTAWCRLQWSHLTLRGKMLAVTRQDAATTLSITAAGLMQSFAVSEHGLAVDRLSQTQLDGVWARADRLVRATSLSMVQHVPPQIALITGGAPIPATVPATLPAIEPAAMPVVSVGQYL